MAPPSPLASILNSGVRSSAPSRLATCAAVLWGSRAYSISSGPKRLGRLTGWLASLGVFVSVGCGAPGPPLELTTLDPSQDQWAIASYYSQEATRLRQKAEELTMQAAVYEQVFGPESEWATGTRLLARFYEDAARERERQADLHLGVARRRQLARPDGLAPSP